MIYDKYEDFAERYDWMKKENPERTEFFERIFAKHHVASVLDCACGTGRDLSIFHSLGLDVFGSDLSESMLLQAKVNTQEYDIPLCKVDFLKLKENYDSKFDAVVCLNNSINELLEDSETLQALQSMKSVLQPNGILIFDQGQTDYSMQNPPSYAPIINNRNFTRFFTMKYSDNLQTVNIFDFTHTEQISEFNHTSVKIRIRLLDSWQNILRKAGFTKIDFYGAWNSDIYDKKASARLICVAQK